MSSHPAQDRLRLLEPSEYTYVLAGFRELLARGPELERHLRGVVEDTLNHPGSLVRAQLSYTILRELQVEPQPARDLAVAIEYFHTASLLFDDMPAMDDAQDRRGHACPHLNHGEAATTLAALGFINRGYALLWNVIGPLPEARREASAKLVNESLGLAGILNGQSRDIHFGEGPRTAESVRSRSASSDAPSSLLSGTCTVKCCSSAGARRPACRPSCAVRPCSEVCEPSRRRNAAAGPKGGKDIRTPFVS